MRKQWGTIGEQLGETRETLGKTWGEIVEHMGRNEGEIGEELGKQWGDIGEKLGRTLGEIWGKHETNGTEIDQKLLKIDQKSTFFENRITGRTLDQVKKVCTVILLYLSGRISTLDAPCLVFGL